MNPLFLMLPATLTASCAFMLPVSTAPNAIVFEASNLRTVEMIKVGLGMNLITLAVIVGNTYTVGELMFGFKEGLPDWTGRATCRKRLRSSPVFCISLGSHTSIIQFSVQLLVQCIQMGESCH